MWFINIILTLRQSHISHDYSNLSWKSPDLVYLYNYDVAGIMISGCYFGNQSTHEV